jgi:hypothetical protein
VWVKTTGVKKDCKKRTKKRTIEYILGCIDDAELTVLFADCVLETVVTVNQIGLTQRLIGVALIN